MLEELSLTKMVGQYLRWKSTATRYFPNAWMGLKKQ